MNVLYFLFSADDPFVQLWTKIGSYFLPKIIIVASDLLLFSKYTIGGYVWKLISVAYKSRDTYRPVLEHFSNYKLEYSHEIIMVRSFPDL